MEFAKIDKYVRTSIAIYYILLIACCLYVVFPAIDAKIPFMFFDDGHGVINLGTISLIGIVMYIAVFSFMPGFHMSSIAKTSGILKFKYQVIQLFALFMLVAVGNYLVLSDFPYIFDIVVYSYDVESLLLLLFKLQEIILYMFLAVILYPAIMETIKRIKTEL